MAEARKLCTETVSAPGNSFHTWTCGRVAKVTRAGKHYCGVHDPERAPTAAQLAAKHKRARELAAMTMRHLACEIADCIAAGNIPALDLISRYVEQRALARPEPKETL